MYDGEWTIGSVLAARAEQQPDREIVRFEDEALTYGAPRRDGEPRCERARRPRARQGRPGRGDARQPARVPRALVRRRARRPRRGAAEHGPPRRHARAHAEHLRLPAARDRRRVAGAGRAGRLPARDAGADRRPRRGTVPGLECLPHELLLAGAAGRPDAVVVSARPVRDPLHVGHDRPLQGRGPLASRQLQRRLDAPAR